MRKPIGIFFTFVTAALLSSCAQAPATDYQSTTASGDYEASEDISDFRPYIYGNRTIIEFAKSPFGLAIKDENGKDVGYKTEGRYYLLDRKLEYFTVSRGGHEVMFTAIIKNETAHLPPMATEPEVEVIVTPVRMMDSFIPLSIVHKTDAPIFKLMQRQLSLLKELYSMASLKHQVSGEELFGLNKKLDQLESTMDEGIAVIFLTFPKYGTKPNPDTETLDALLPATRSAKKVILCGRTNSVIAGEHDASIALRRATNTKQMLIDRGVSKYKIEINALASGDFIAPNRSKLAKEINRRVEIKIIPNEEI